MPLEGTIVYDWQLGRPWPVEDELPLFATPGGDAFVRCFGVPGGIFRFEVVDDEGNVHSIMTCPIRIDDTTIRFAFAWKIPDDLVVFANGIKIAGADIDPHVIVQLPHRKTQKLLNFSSQNEDALRARIEDAKNLRPRDGRRLRTLNEEIAFLKGAIAQLNDFVRLMDAGHHYHAPACMALLRSLIALGNRNFKPLLQRIAGRLSSPLIVYATALQDDLLVSSEPTHDFKLWVSGVPEDRTSAIDLDVWLGLSGGLFNGDRFTNNDLIRTIADATASHFDPDADLMLDAIERMAVFSENKAIPITIGYTMVLATCILHLSSALIEHTSQYST